MNDKRSPLVERVASADDEAWLWELYCEVLKPWVEEQWGWDEKFQHSNFHEYMGLSLFCIVEHDGKRAGAYAAQYETSRIYLHLLMVAPEFQKLGLGGQILDELKAAATRQKLPIEMAVIATNPVVRFYLSNGFVKGEKTEDKQFYSWTP